MRRGGTSRTDRSCFFPFWEEACSGCLAWPIVIATQFERLRPVIEARCPNRLAIRSVWVAIEDWVFRASAWSIVAQPGSADQSTAAIERLSIGFNPLESLLRLRPVLPVRFRRSADLSQCARGLLVPGPLPQGGAPPRLDRKCVDDPARIRIALAGLTLSAAGWSGIQLDERRAQASLQLMLPDRGRVVRGRGDGSARSGTEHAVGGCSSAVIRVCCLTASRAAQGLGARCLAWRRPPPMRRRTLAGGCDGQR